MEDHKYLLIPKRLAYLYKEAVIIFHEKRGANLAAASTFFFLLTLVPMALLSFKVIGLLLGDVNGVLEDSFVIVSKFFPDVLPEFVDKIKGLIARPLKASGGITFFNALFLAFSTFTLFNSIWSGLYIISENKSHISITKALKDMLVISFTVSFLGITLFLPSLFSLIRFLLTKNIVVDMLNEFGPAGERVVEIWLESNNLLFSLAQSDLFYVILLIAYVTILFHWFFSRHLSWLESLFTSVSFTATLLMLKSFFWIYFRYVRESFLTNYGDFYTVIIGVMWLYFAMCCFYFSLCLSQSFAHMKSRG